MFKGQIIQVGSISYRDTVTGEITANASLYGKSKNKTGFENLVLETFINDLLEFLQLKKECETEWAEQKKV